MKKLTQKNEIPELRDDVLQRFSLLLGGFAFFAVLHSGIKLGIFELLHTCPRLNEEEIRKKLNLKMESAQILTHSLSSLGLLEEKARKFKNANVATIFLVRSSRANILDTIEAYHRLMYKPMFHLEESFKSGRNSGLKAIGNSSRTLYELLAKDSSLRTVFNGWMKNLANSAVANPRYYAFLDTILLSKKYAVDVGGGAGERAIALCKRYPSLSVTILDLPANERNALSNIKKNKLSHRIKFKSGNFLKTPFPENVDVFLFFNIFNIYSPQKNVGLLRKALLSLTKSGKVVGFNSFSLPNDENSVSSTLLSLYFLNIATGQGKVYQEKDHQKWFRMAGFRNACEFFMVGPSNGFVFAGK